MIWAYPIFGNTQNYPNESFISTDKNISHQSEWSSWDFFKRLNAVNPMEESTRNKGIGTIFDNKHMNNRSCR